MFELQDPDALKTTLRWFLPLQPGKHRNPRHKARESLSPPPGEVTANAPVSSGLSPSTPLPTRPSAVGPTSLSGNPRTASYLLQTQWGTRSTLGLVLDQI